MLVVSCVAALGLVACPKKHHVEPDGAGLGESGREPPPVGDGPEAVGTPPVLAPTVARPSPPVFDDDTAFVEPWTLAKAAAAPSPVVTTGVCLASDGDLVPFWAPVATASGVALCTVTDFEQRIASCLEVDVDSGEVRKVSTPKEFLARMGGAPLVDGPVRRSEDGATAESCVGTCVPLALGGVAAGKVGVVGRFVFVGPPLGFDEGPSDDKGPQGGPYIRIFDGKTGTPVTAIDISAFESACPDIFGIGDILYVSFGVCAGPGAMGYMFDPATGRLLGALGGAANSAPAYDVSPVAIGDQRYVFRDQYGMALYVHSGLDGALVSRLNLSAALHAPHPDEGFATSPEEGGIARLADGRLVVTHGDAQRDRVVVVDATASRILKVLTIRACP